MLAALAFAVFVVPGVCLAQSQSVASLKAKIQSLTVQLQSLEAKLPAAGGTTATWCYTFNTNLSIGMSGSAVAAIQTALQKDGESATVNGTFDDRTAAAVTAFQEKYQSAVLAPYGLNNGTGYAGKSTRAELNFLFGCGITQPQPITPPIVVSSTPLPVQTPTQPTSTNVSLSMISPNGGEQWSAGNRYTIQWSASGLSSVNLVLYKGSSCSAGYLGSSVCGVAVAAQPTIPTAIANNAPNTETHSWTIPSFISAGTDYRIAVQDPSNAPHIAQSSGPFTIINSGISQNPTSTPLRISQINNWGATKTNNSVALNWQAATASAGIGGYDVYRTTTSGCTANTANCIYEGNALSYNDAGLSPGTYYYCIAAQDVNGNIGPISSQLSIAVTSANATPTVTIQLDPANPTAAQVQTGASNVPLLAFDIVNSFSDPMRITSLMALEHLQPMATSTMPQFNNVTLYDTTSGSNVSIGTFSAFSAPQSILEIASANLYPSRLTIPANATERFLLTGSIPSYVTEPFGLNTSGLFYVAGATTSITVIDANTNTAEPVSGFAQGDVMTIVQGQ